MNFWEYFLYQKYDDSDIHIYNSSPTDLFQK